MRKPSFIQGGEGAEGSWPFILYRIKDFRATRLSPAREAAPFFPAFWVLLSVAGCDITHQPSENGAFKPVMDRRLDSS